MTAAGVSPPVDAVYCPGLGSESIPVAGAAKGEGARPVLFGAIAGIGEGALKGKAGLAAPPAPLKPVERAARRSAAALAAALDDGSPTFQDDGFTERWRL